MKKCSILSSHTSCSRTAGHSGMLVFFNSKDIGEERIITYIISDVSFKFKIKDSMIILKWIEENYMESMDSDSWYGYKCALNNI